MTYRLLSALVALAIAQPTTAEGIGEAFAAAQRHDPQFRAAMAERSATQQLYPMARASQLPQISIAWSDAHIQGTETTTIANSSVSNPLDYRAPVRNLSLRMPLYNREALQKLDISSTQIAYGEQVFSLKTTDLLERLVSAWLQKWLLREEVARYEHELGIAHMKRDQAQRAHSMGEVSKIESDEAIAALALANAKLQEARNQYHMALQAYGDIVGNTPPPSPITEQPQLYSAEVSPSLCHIAGESLQSILGLAVEESPSIAARRIALDLSRKAHARSESGHYPRLDLIASAQNSRNESISTLNKQVDQQSIGFQFTLPLYSGGYVASAVKQASFDIDKAQAELDAEVLNVGRTVRRAYFGCVDNANQANVQHQLMQTYKASWIGLDKARLAGVASQADVVAGEQRVLQARSEWARALRDMGLASVQLLTRSGANPKPALAQLELLVGQP